MVSVRLRGRSLDWVIEDMIQGVLVVNGLDGAEQARMGASLGAAVRRDRDVDRAA